MRLTVEGVTEETVPTFELLLLMTKTTTSGIILMVIFSASSTIELNRLAVSP